MQLQKNHFNRIASKYLEHYDDLWSQKYRYKYINEPMFENIQLSGMKVVEGMCGFGATTGYLLSKGAYVTGIDISENMINIFRKKWPNCTALCTSILETGLESESFDCVTVVGGLHHLHPKVKESIQEIHRILKVGGFFCFLEPHKGSLMNLFRSYWYKLDKLFADNEEAIDLEALKMNFSSKFDFIKEEYKRNIAYLLVFQSLIFRMPLKLKSIYSPSLMWLESIIEKVLGKKSSCVVLCQWKKI
jgi:ubiquinone/menaquinone biosynthesis C-methylase UbiE